MTIKSTMHSAVAGVRRHPRRAAAVFVPLLAAAVFVGTAVASAKPEPTLAVSRTELNAAPAPDIHIDFANQPPKRVVKVKKPGVTANKPVAQVNKPVTTNEPRSVDGCDHNYGTPNVCVPWKIPAPAGQACAWLKAMGYGPLKVYGTNRQNLPENAQGYVCATGAE